MRPEDAKEATALFKAGRALIDAGKPAEACPKFQQSQRLDPAEGTLLNLADCYERIGKTASAWTSFAEVVKLSKQSKREDRGKVARERMEALKPKLSWLVIDVPDASRVPDLEIRRDSDYIPRTEWGVRVPVNPGHHIITASAPPNITWKEDVEVDDATMKLITIALPLSSEPASLSPERYSTRMVTGGIVLIAFGTVGLIAGGVVVGTGAIGNNPTNGIPFLVGGGALLAGGILVTSIGAQEVSVNDKERQPAVSLVFGPLSAGIKVSF